MVAGSEVNDKVLILIFVMRCSSEVFIGAASSYEVFVFIGFEFDEEKG